MARRSFAPIATAVTCIAASRRSARSHTWHNLIPYVDRLNYVSALNNTFAYCEAVEKLMGVEIPPRARYLRTLLSEYSRVIDHLTCIAAGLMELGAMTAFLYLVMIRDYMYEHIANLTGARVTHSYGRIGGVAHDLPAGWLERMEEILVQADDFVGRVHKLVDRNRIFIDRMRNVGTISQADAISYGCTGPLLRSTGLARDLRKDTPYLAYAELDFEVPVGINGDNYDRYYVRMREIDESVHMMRQVATMLPQGPIVADDRRCSFPPKPLVYGEIESLINHFKLVMDGPKVPAGEIYFAHESPNGELGFYLVSDGSRQAVQGARARAELRPHGRRKQDARRIPVGRRRADVRLDQHDRRGVRSMKHLIPEFEKMKARFPAGFESSLVLPCLRRIQEDRGYVADSDIEELTAYLKVPRIQIEEVLGYYTQFRRQPVGRVHIEVCRNVSCSMRGAERLLEHLENKLGVAPGETTTDGRFTLSTCECLGSCGTAPVVVVNDAYHENATAAQLDALIDGSK